jgi:Putative amidoligase enzyme
MRYNEFLSEDELFEINMSPNNLTKLVKEIPGAMVGLEFEMIVPDISVDDDGGNNGENDYDMDERCDDIDDVVDFFQRGNGGDYNSADRLRDRLREDFYEWVSEASSEAWGEVASSEVRDWLENNTSIKEDAMQEYRDENPDADDDEVDAAGESAFEAAYDEAMDEAWGNTHYDSAHEQWRDDYESDLSERDWLRNQGYHYMSDIEGNYDETYWPYQHESSSDNEDLATIAAEIEQATGRDVQSAAGYHDISRGDQASEGFYILETDGSLRPSSGSDAGLELVSPPLAIGEMMEEIKKIADWAKSRGCYTGKSNKTGLHMNVSVPNYSRSKLDFVKLALLLGDNHVLKEFDRYVVQGTNYAQSSFDLLAKSLKNNPDKAKKMMEAMKGHFDAAASKAIHSGATDKYTSINTKDNRVEFRGPGNDYLSMFEANPNKLLAPMMRMVVALEAACDPEKYRQEYQKKLYKLLSSSVKSKDLLEIFTNYAAGKGMPDSAFKSFLRQRKSERDLDKDLSKGNKKYWWKVKWGNADVEVVASNHDEALEQAINQWGITREEGKEQIRSEADVVMQRTFEDMRPSNPDGNWILFKQIPTGDVVTPYKVQVLYRFFAADGNDAGIVRKQWVALRKIDAVDAIEIKVGDDREKKYGQPDDTAVSSPSARTKYEIYSRSDGRVVNDENGAPIRFTADNPNDAANKIARILSDYNISGDPDAYDVRSVLNVPSHTSSTTQSNSTGNWGLWLGGAERFARWPSTENLRRFPTEQAAKDYLNNLRQSTVGMRNDIEVREIDPTPAAPTATGAPQATSANGVPMWVIYRISDGEVVHRFADHPVSHSRTALTWLRDQNYENPAVTFRVRAMTQDEYSRARDPNAVQSTPPPNWETVNDRTGQVVHRFYADNQNNAIAAQFDYLTSRGLTTDDFTLQSIERAPQAQQARQEPGRQFTGTWLVKDNSGRELYRFNGVGNNQADANRVAAQWAQRNMVSGEFDVVPEMA